jgi:hypothetical protein
MMSAATAATEHATMISGRRLNGGWNRTLRAGIAIGFGT